ncbi:SPFH domain-containing protein [Candidatus Uabimicrobium sp. HlEnr_7]|uniref:SPFH domain-containing protein n=1 Tax=Candidatus Uabimicrobium helgolandensis TaxID=3095367 RepID=UPI0035566A26
MFKSQKIQILEYEKGLLYKKGRFDKLLDSGCYTIKPWQSLSIKKVDMREHSHVTNTKNFMTKNREEISLNLILRYKINDPSLSLHRVEDYKKQILQDLQMVSQKCISQQSLEEILVDSEDLIEKIRRGIQTKTKEYGLFVTDLQIDDLNSPGISSKMINIWEYEKGLLYRKGKFEKLVDSGRYTLHSWEHCNIIKIDTRETTITIPTREIHTKNNLKVDIELIVHYKIVEPQKICNVKDYESQIFQDISNTLQQSMLDYTVEEALGEHTLIKILQKNVVEKTQEYGVQVLNVKIEHICVPRKQDQIVDIWEYEKGLLYREGKFEKLLDSGRHSIRSWEPLSIVKLDLREVSTTIQAQEILTKDKIGVRVTLIAQYQIINPTAAIHNVDNYQEQLYQDLQLTLRENITGRSTEEILEDRDVLSAQLLDEIAPRVEKYGVLLHRVGVKDIILPGVVRNVFLQEVEADRRGRAERISARYAVSIARSKANTAKILQENPHVMRLKELETLAEMASKEGNVVIIPGLSNLCGTNVDSYAKESENGKA